MSASTYLPAGYRMAHCACGGYIVAFSGSDVPRAVLEHNTLDPQHILWREKEGLDYPEHVRYLKVDAYEGRLVCQ